MPFPRPSLPPGGRALPTPTVMPLSDIAASMEGVSLMLVEFAFPATFAGAGTVVSMGCVERKEGPSLLPEECALPTPTVIPLMVITALTESVSLMLVESAIPRTFAGAGTVVLMDGVDRKEGPSFPPGEYALLTMFAITRQDIPVSKAGALLRRMVFAMLAIIAGRGTLVPAEGVLGNPVKVIVVKDKVFLQSARRWVS